MALEIPGFGQTRGWEVIPGLRMGSALNHKKKRAVQFQMQSDGVIGITLLWYCDPAHCF